MEPLKIPILSVTSSEGTSRWVGRIPGLRAMARHRRYCRRRKQIIDSVNDQLSKRVPVREQWREEPEVAAAAKTLCRAIQSATGIRCEQVIGDDPVDALLIASIDALESVEVMFDLEDWLRQPIEPGFFNESFCQMTVRQASLWLARNRKPV